MRFRLVKYNTIDEAYEEDRESWAWAGADWDYKSAGKPCEVWLASGDTGVTGMPGMFAGAEKPAHLIAAAPDGLKAASDAYLAILSAPPSGWRAAQGMNGTLAGLRDFIAKATNRDPQDVQEDYEAKAKGESQ